MTQMFVDTPAVSSTDALSIARTAERAQTITDAAYATADLVRARQTKIIGNPELCTIVEDHARTVLDQSGATAELLKKVVNNALYLLEMNESTVV